ncbi:MAG TPA: alpha/beta fold hydrolase, partial [Ktedonobacterales bacterium]
MATQSKYAPERAGDWGVPAAAAQSYETGAITMSDGVTLFYRHWASAAPAPTLALLHGLGAHTGWFIDMGNELQARGLNVYAVDHRGFGRSEGARGHVTDGGVYLRDLNTFLAQIRMQQPNSPLFILGHSMGAIFALNLAAEDSARTQPTLAGLILMNPWIDDRSKVSPAKVASLLISGRMGSTRPFQTGDTNTMTTNPEALAMLNDDALWVRAESASFLYHVTMMRLKAVAQARKTRIPALVIQCEQDLAVVAAASRRAYDALASADKTWKTYANFAHDVEFEPERAIL